MKRLKTFLVAMLLMFSLSATEVFAAAAPAVNPTETDDVTVSSENGNSEQLLEEFSETETSVPEEILPEEADPGDEIAAEAAEFMVQNVNAQYEIYPTPQKAVYGAEGFIIRPEVNVVFDSSVDEATRAHLNDVLAMKEKSVTVSEERVTGKTNILVGINGSGEYAETYIKEHYTVDESLFAHYGSYFFDTTQNEIVILGRNTDAAFYGITTLKAIFNQIDGSRIGHLTMEDYADVNIRGFIEGYYGMPWTNEDRMELMRFGGDIKMTSYIFAPKNDPYHKEKWREEYPADELARLKEMVDVGNATKCRFVWTAHPFMGGFDPNNAEQEIQTLINKFEHLYNDAGVRQFGVLGDDVGGLSRTIVVDMMQKVGEWAESKGDVYDVVFCPAGYNHSWQGDYSELNSYDKDFPENVQIFWTGEAVCQPIEQKTLDHFRDQNAVNGKRRAPLFWLNWPVNDINHSRMIMGHATKLLQTNINTNDLAGAVTNPMQESEPSKVAIFQLADYAWNVESFNGRQCWEDSFKYIEPNAADEMYTLAKHMSNPEPNGHGLVMPESEELAPKLDELRTALEAGTATEAQIDAIIAEFETIIAACDGFEAKSRNEELKEDLAPFIASMRDLCEAGVNFLQAKKTLDAQDSLGAFNFYTAGQEKLKASEKHTKPMLSGGTEAVDPGSTALIPFVKKMDSLLSGPMSEFIAGGEDKMLKITASSSFNSFYAGNINNIIDGNNQTHAWYGGYEAAGQYYQVNFSIPQTVYGIHILNGAANDGKARDTFGTGKIMYQQSGSEEWKQLGDVYADYPERVDVSEIELENVVAVRYECHAAGSESKWPSMREFSVSIQPEDASAFTKEVIHIPDVWAAGDAEKAKMVDGDLSTSVHFQVRNNNSYGGMKDHYQTGDYCGVKLSQPITLGKIDILQGLNDGHGDYFKKAKLQYSMDGTTWTDLPGAENLTERHVVFDASNQNIKAQYVRLIATEGGATWIAIREFDVDAKVFYNAKAYTNVDALKNLGANVYEESAYLAAKNGITLNNGEYVGIRLDRIHEIMSITKNLTGGDQLTLEVGQNEYEFSAYESGAVNARYVRLINRTENPVTFDLKEFSLASKEFYPNTFLSNDSNFSIYDQANNPAPMLFDGDWTTQVIFNGSQTEGRHFVYDLGQEISIEKLKVVCRDSEHDFPRHGLISVSSDKNTWTPLMELGNQTEDNPGEAQDKDEIGYVLPNHEISYNTKEVALEQAVTGRYIKFEITRTKSGSDKWVRFQEFIINDGKHVPMVNDPTFESDAEETKNGRFAYLTDGDLTTAFIPSKDTGKLTYHVSEKNQQNAVKIVQAANPISNAQVKARVLNANGTEETVLLGTLSQTVNEFVLPTDVVLLDVIIEWSDVTPILNEMILSVNTEAEVGDKGALQNLLDQPEDTSKWTASSKAAYDQAIANALKVNESVRVTQETVDAAVKAIETAIESKEIKGDVRLLQEKLDGQMTDEKLYTVSSWRKYQEVIGKLTAAVNDADNTSEAEVTSLLADYEAALNGLSYSPLKAEEAELVLEDEKVFMTSVTKPEETYTDASWKTYTDKVSELENTLEADQTAKVNPTEFQKKLDAVKEAKAGLVSIVNLVPLLKEFEQTDGKLYVESTFEAYKEAVDAGKEAKVNGTTESVEAAVKAIEEAKEGLVLLGNPESVQNFLKELKALKAENYTKESYKALTDAIAKVEELGDLSKLSQEQLDQAAGLLLSAKKGLVSVEALNQAAVRAEAVDETLYTKDSYQALKETLKPVEQLRNNGTADQIQAAVNAIDQAIRNLKVRVSADYVKDYMDSIVFNDKEKDYTKDSYQAYKNAYDRLVALSKDLENTSKEEFLAAVEAFETAEKNLKKVENKKEQEAANDAETQKGFAKTGDTASVAGWSVLLLFAAAAMIVLGKKMKKEEEI